MVASHSRPASVSTVASLMQEVPGSFPAFNAANQDHASEDEPSQISLSKAVHARRAEYVQQKHVRMKIGTWNVAGIKETYKDVAGWFVEGKGVSEALAGLEVQDQNELHGNRNIPTQSALDAREDVATQEARHNKRQTTLPNKDPGSLPGHTDVDLYVLGLQEMVDVNSVSEAWNPLGGDQAAAIRWKDAVTKALPSGYKFIAEQQLVGLYLLIFATSELASEIRCVSTTSVGTGIGGILGNKGAVTSRLVLGETTRLVFVNSHLAAGADKSALERRNWDASQIISRTRFEPIKDVMDLQQTKGEQIGDEDFAFWMGDLNYRLEGIPGDDVRRLLMLHTRNEYDLGSRSAEKVEAQLKQAKQSVEERQAHEVLQSGTADGHAPQINLDGAISSTRSALQEEIEASSDPASLQTTLSSLLPHDELHQQMKARSAFHDGWEEGKITFLPTYKYDVGSVGVFDSSEKKRGPSWCDRILYRTRRNRLAYQAKAQEEESSQRRDVEMRASGVEQAANEEELLYDYDPEQDGDDDYNEATDGYADLENDNVVITKESFEDELLLEYYTAHQRVLSSDHKPLNAIFSLRYDAVVPELKAKIYAEVAKEYDKVENEGRPTVTVVVDKHRESDNEKSDAEPGEFDGVDFGHVRWAQAKHRTITVANTGRVPASFVLIERPLNGPQDSGVAPSWLNVKINDELISSSSRTTSPVVLQPGDTSMIELEFRVLDITVAGELNDGSRKIDENLVLRVENGRDHFVPVRASWLVTSLSSAIDKLIRVPEGGIRKLQGQKLKDLGSKVSSAPDQHSDLPVRFSAPRELLKLTEAVEQLSIRIIAEWDMMRPSSSTDMRASTDSTVYMPTSPWIEFPGWPFNDSCWTERSTRQFETALGDAVNALDADLPLLDSIDAPLPQIQKLYVLTCLLHLFLRHMPDGVVDLALWTQIEDHLNQKEKAKSPVSEDDTKLFIQEVLAQQPSHNISFILIMAMAERILLETTNSIGVEYTDTIEQQQQQPISPVRKAGASIRKIATFGKLPADSTVSLSDVSRTHMLRTFAELLIRGPSLSSDRARNALERRKVEVLGLFLPQQSRSD